MATLPQVSLGADWQLIYDAVASGDFVGGISHCGGSPPILRIAPALPAPADGGWSIEDDSESISISSFAEQKLYGRAYSGSSSIVQLDRSLFPAAFPPGAFIGLRALTVQFYPEANVKRGLQFFARAAWPLADTIDPGETVKLYFVTGSKPVILKLRELSYIAEELELRLYANPTGVSGGTDLSIKNYNLRDPQATTVVTAKKNVATTSDGAEIEPNDPEHFFGAGAVGNRSVAVSPTGFERIIPVNSNLLVTLKNTGSSVARAQYFLTWYEGDTDIDSGTVE